MNLRHLKAAALVLNSTDAIIAGTEIGGFDTHRAQGQLTGTHPFLNRDIGWSLYALRKFFMIYGKGGSSPLPGATTSWDDLVIVTLSEFGRTTVENADAGTDHAEASVMWLAGGGIKGYQAGVRSGIFNCGPGSATTSGEFAANSPLNWFTGASNASAMFGVSNGYLKRNTDYRSVLGELIRKHLGATQGQLNQIIPGYADPNERLLTGGTAIDGTSIRGEAGFL